MTNKDRILHVRITNEMRDELECLASEDGRSLSDYVRRVLERHLQSMECLRELAGGPVLYVEPPKQPKKI